MINLPRLTNYAGYFYGNEEVRVSIVCLSLDESNWFVKGRVFILNVNFHEKKNIFNKKLKKKGFYN